MWYLLLVSGMFIRYTKSLIQLECKNHGIGVSQDLGHGITMIVANISDVGLAPDLPCALDFNDTCHSPKFFATSSVSSFYCSYELKDFIISSDGGIFPHNHRDHSPNLSDIVIFDYEAIRSRPGYSVYKADATSPAKNYNPARKPPSTYDVVVPLRVKWDDVFNHLSFEVLPTIGAAFHFYKSSWESIHFHACMHSAALLQLLGVNESRIIIKETLHAKQVLLPATPYFHSDWILNRPAPFRGITKEVSSRLTESLLNMTIELSVLAKLHPWTVECISHPTVSSETLLAHEDGDFRYIVFLSRRGQERSLLC